MSRIYIKTSKGAQGLLDGSIGLDERHVRILSLLDGTRGPAQLADLASFPQAETADILQKLILIGYARATGFQTPPSTLDLAGHAAQDFDQTFGPSPSGSTFDPASIDNLDDSIDLNAVRQAAKSRISTMQGPIGLGNAEDAWRQTEEMAKMVMAERLERERLQREAAELALEQARQREADMALARKRSEEERQREIEAAEASRKSAEAAAAARLVEQEIERAKERRLGMRQKRIKYGSIMAVALAFFGIALRIQTVLSIDADVCSRFLTQWAQTKSSAKECSASFFPAPHFEAKGLKIGEISIEEVEGALLFFPLFAGHLEPSSLIVRGASLDTKSAASFARTPNVIKSNPLRQIEIERAELHIGNQNWDGLRGSILLSSRGQIESLIFNDEERMMKLSITSETGITKASFQARFANADIAPIAGLVDLSLDGILLHDGFQIEQGTWTHKAGIGRVLGDVYWSSGQWVAKGSYEAKGVSVLDMAPWLFNSGRAELSGNFAASGKTLGAALERGSFDSDLQLKDVSLKIDLPETLGVNGSAGHSAFQNAQAKASFNSASQRYAFPMLQSGPMKATLDIKKTDNRITGEAAVSIPERSMQAESTIGGTAQRIVLSPKNRK